LGTVENGRRTKERGEGFSVRQMRLGWRKEGERENAKMKKLIRRCRGKGGKKGRGEDQRRPGEGGGCGVGRSV